MLTHLTLGPAFNRQFEHSLDTLVQLTELNLGVSFNQPFNNSLTNLKILSKITLYDAYDYKYQVKLALNNLITVKYLYSDRAYYSNSESE